MVNVCVCKCKGMINTESKTVVIDGERGHRSGQLQGLSNILVPQLLVHSRESFIFRFLNLQIKVHTFFFMLSIIF